MDSATPLNQFIADIAAGEADDRAMSVFEEMAADDAHAWRRLALTLHDELRMRAALSTHLDHSAQQASREIDRAMQQSHDAPQIVTHPARRWTAWSAWSGWSVAAALLLAVFILLPQRAVLEPAFENGSTTLASYSAQQALDRYVVAGTEEGRVVAELPTVMVEARPTDDGRLEVLYLRQFVERETVNEVYTLASDDLGLPHPVQIDYTGWNSSTDSSL